MSGGNTDNRNDLAASFHTPAAASGSGGSHTSRGGGGRRGGRGGRDRAGRVRNAPGKEWCRVCRLHHEPGKCAVISLLQAAADLVQQNHDVRTPAHDTPRARPVRQPRARRRARRERQRREREVEEMRREMNALRQQVREQQEMFEHIQQQQPDREYLALREVDPVPDRPQHAGDTQEAEQVPEADGSDTIPDQEYYSFDYLP